MAILILDPCCQSFWEILADRSPSPTCAIWWTKLELRPPPAGGIWWTKLELRHPPPPQPPSDTGTTAVSGTQSKSKLPSCCKCRTARIAKSVRALVRHDSGPGFNSWQPHFYITLSVIEMVCHDSGCGFDSRQPHLCWKQDDHASEQLAFKEVSKCSTRG